MAGHINAAFENTHACMHQPTNQSNRHKRERKREETKQHFASMPKKTFF